MLAPMIAALAPTPSARPSEVWDRATTEKAGVVWRGNHTISPLPHETLATEDLPESFSWCDKGMCTMSRNQHIPQYVYERASPSLVSTSTFAIPWA